MPLWNPYDVAAAIATHAGLPTVHHSPPVGANDGNYVGNNGVDRAIAHGLAGTPRVVIIMERTNPGSMSWINQGAAVIIYIFAANYGGLAVSAMTSTNFYVGNASNYGWSKNGTGTTYDWIAIL